MSFAATWMDLEVILLSEVGQVKTNVTHDRLYVHLKSDTNELMNKTEIDSQERKKQQLKATKGERGTGIN